MGTQTEIDLAKLYRLYVDSRSRRASSVGIVHSGSSQTILACVCGAHHTTATRHRGRTRHEAEFRTAHSDCMLRAICYRTIGGRATQMPREKLLATLVSK